MPRYETAVRRLTKRADTFFGMELYDYILTFAYLRDDRIVFNENRTMQDNFSVWLAFDSNHHALHTVLLNRLARQEATA